MELDRAIDAKYNEFSKFVYGSKIIPSKYIELIALSNSVAVYCKHCIKHHYQKARTEGASDKEISTAIAIAMTVRAGKCRGVANEIIGGLEELEEGGML